MTENNPEPRRTQWPTAKPLQDAADAARAETDPRWHAVADHLDVVANNLAWLAPFREHEPGSPMWASAENLARAITNPTPTIPVDPTGTTYMHLDHGPWEPSGLECGDIDPNHTHCEQPVQQRTVTAVYPLGQRIHLGVELQPHDQHANDNT